MTLTTTTLTTAMAIMTTMRKTMIFTAKQNYKNGDNINNRRINNNGDIDNNNNNKNNNNNNNYNINNNHNHHSNNVQQKSMKKDRVDVRQRIRDTSFNQSPTSLDCAISLDTLEPQLSYQP